jgi:hypothetical protein
MKGTVMRHFRRKVEDRDDLGQDYKMQPRDRDEQKNVVNNKNVNEESKTRPRDQMKVVSYKQTIPSEQLASALREDHLQKEDPSERVQGQFSNSKSNVNIRTFLKKPKKMSDSLSENIIPPQETKIMLDSLNIGEVVCVPKKLIT